MYQFFGNGYVDKQLVKEAYDKKINAVGPDAESVLDLKDAKEMTIGQANPQG